MNETIQVGDGEVELEAVELIDLGDAAVETRVYHPTQVIVDNTMMLGRSFFE